MLKKLWHSLVSKGGRSGKDVVEARSLRKTSIDSLINQTVHSVYTTSEVYKHLDQLEILRSMSLPTYCKLTL